MNEVTNIKIGGVITPDLLDIAYISLNSIKCNKKSTTKIDYYLFIKYTYSLNEYYCKRYLDDLISDDFQIHYIDANPYIKETNPQNGFSDVLFIRCLFPKIFNEFDKILHLDIDVFCLKEGIEELWNMTVDEFYVKAAIDPLVSWSPEGCADYYNTQTKRYFNAGLMLMNLKKIREDGLDEILYKWTKNWDYTIIRCILHDQTLLNYFFRKHVGILSPIWNNMFLSSTVNSKQYFTHNLQIYGFGEPLESLNETVFIHFIIKEAKPWNIISTNKGLGNFYYAETSIQLWKELVANYEKRRHEKQS